MVTTANTFRAAVVAPLGKPAVQFGYWCPWCETVHVHGLAGKTPAEVRGTTADRGAHCLPQRSPLAGIRCRNGLPPPTSPPMISNECAVRVFPSPGPAVAAKSVASLRCPARAPISSGSRSCSMTPAFPPSTAKSSGSGRGCSHTSMPIR